MKNHLNIAEEDIKRQSKSLFIKNIFRLGETNSNPTACCITTNELPELWNWPKTE